MKIHTKSWLPALISLLLVGCGGGSSIMAPNTTPHPTPTTPQPTPTVTPFPQTHVYVANGSGSGFVTIYGGDLSSTSTPNVAFQDGTSTDVEDVAFDASGRLYVSNFEQNKIDVFTPPFTNTSTPTFSMATGTGPEGVDIDGAGNLYVANSTSATLTIYNAPLSGTSTAATTITTGLARPIGVKLDVFGKLYVADNTKGVVQIYTPPFTNTSAPTVSVPLPGAWGIFIDGGDLWASDSASIKEFVPPFTSTSTAALTLSAGLTSPKYPAVSGGLWVSDSGFIRVWTEFACCDFGGSPTFSFAAPNPNGIRFGP
jgi:hypothetical protein